MDADSVTQSHLTEAEVVAYLGHELTDHPLRQVEQHLAGCSECRDEIVEAREILAQPRRSRWRVLAPVAAAAAAIVLFIVWPVNPDTQPGPSQHRDAPLSGVAASAPSLITPVGPAIRFEEMVWSRVGDADRYRLTLYDDGGVVIWRATTADTSVPFPDTLELQQSLPYLWKVEARVGWDVWQSSDLTQFELRDQGAGPATTTVPGDSVEP